MMAHDVVTLGNVELLQCEKVAFLSSRRVPPETVMKSYDWATQMCAEGVCVIGGFQSALERDVLKILLKGTQPVVLVLARAMWQTVPVDFRMPIDTGRLLVVSPVAQTIHRVSCESAAIRNRYVLSNCTSVTFAAVDTGGSLDRLLSEFPNLPRTIL